jgi:hypothetical protein
MEGAGGEEAYMKLSGQLINSTTACKEFLKSDSGAGEIGYAERLAMFRGYWADHRGKTLGEYAGPTSLDYSMSFKEHMGMTPREYRRS